MERDELNDTTFIEDETGGEEGQLDPNNPEHAFSILERDFTQVSQYF